MTPATGERLLRFVGDKIRIQLRQPNAAAASNYQARLRTNLGRAAMRRREIIAALGTLPCDIKAFLKCLFELLQESGLI